MNRTPYLIAVGMMMAGFSTASAQATASNTCNGREPVASLGITGIACDCTISVPGDGRDWQFRTEPRITALNAGSRAGAVLKVGDVITHVNGKSIRSSEGAEALARIETGKAVILTIRRNGQVLKYALTADSVCPNDTRVLGAYPPRPPSGSVARTPTRPAPPPHVSGVHGAVPQGMPMTTGTTPARSDVSFGMGLACSGNCSIRVKEVNGGITMKFSELPEVYSIEKGGPADKAGIRRGDILTHINGIAMDSDEAGTLFANAKPGETLRFTVQRGRDRRTLSVKAVHRWASRPALAESTESLEKARAALAHVEREQFEQMRHMQEVVREAAKMDESELRDLERELVRHEREHRDKLNELGRELSRAEVRMRAATQSPEACAVPMVAPSASTSLSRTLRYSGSLGGSDIEVRGSSPVSVTENRDEVVITTGGTVVRVKKGR